MLEELNGWLRRLFGATIRREGVFARARKLAGAKIGSDRALASDAKSEAGAGESDRACPCCGADDAIKIDPLLAEGGPRPPRLGGDKPMLCGRCWALLMVAADGRAAAADPGQIDAFRRAYPLNWRAVVRCQEDYQRRQIIAIRGPIRAEGLGYRD